MIRIYSMGLLRQLDVLYTCRFLHMALHYVATGEAVSGYDHIVIDIVII